MGLYYRLQNGEDVEIRIEEKEDYSKELIISLFNGSTTISYDLDKILSLNEILEDIEKDYNKLFQEDQQFTYSCYAD